ncbi:YvcK family protein, partial [Candidatus Dojkabacteria bacterium]|nr:YvcK family protein [Candidatus Dojkabacteria bacterium]
MANIVVIGGGTGSYAILSGLKQLTGHQLTAIVPATDSGGSTGRLRDEFGFLPVGDVRQCLVALAENQDESLSLRELLSYRFDKGGDGLAGHNLGNLLLTALTDISGGEIQAIAILEKLLNIQGHVYPVSLTKTNLVAEYENGETVSGEHKIDEPAYPHDGRVRIANLHATPKVRTHKLVKEAIADADVIIMGPGDLYTSLIANLVVGGVAEALQAAKAKFVYI